MESMQYFPLTEEPSNQLVGLAAGATILYELLDAKMLTGPVGLHSL